MKLYQLHAKQGLTVSKQAAWEFLSSPGNLAKITPDHMGFTILSGAEKAMFPGQIIQYIVKPFPFLATKWVTEITHVEKGHYFVDEQRFGPYSLWHHKHFIKEVDGGVEMEDIIDYKLPLGFLGRLMHALVVKRQLTTIFSFREKKLAEVFGEINTYQNSIVLKSI